MKFNFKNKLSTLVLTSLMAFSTNGLTEKTATKIKVNVENNQGKVTILKNKDGKRETINESFTLSDGDDTDAIVQNILSKHGVDEKSHRINISDYGKDRVWLQKNNNVNLNVNNGKATVTLIKSANGETETIEEMFDVEANTDINSLIDAIMEKHDIDVDTDMHRKVIKLDRQFSRIDEDKPRLGFMASVQEDGWKIVSVVPDSGAADAGLITGDLITSIDGQSTAKGGLGLTEYIGFDKKIGDISDIAIKRDDNELLLGVEARMINSPDVIMHMNNGDNWFSKSGDQFTFNSDGMNEMFEGLHVDVEHLGKMIHGFGDKEIRVVTTGDADAYFFAGSKMNQWLGKNHHFSILTESLGKYFGTTEGVLVLEVAEDNKLGLKDGDVIQAINGEDVHSPKDVVKIMSGFKSDETFEIEIIREKETIYLES